MLTSNFEVLRPECVDGTAVFDDSFSLSALLRVPSLSLVLEFFVGSLDASEEMLLWT